MVLEYFPLIAFCLVSPFVYMYIPSPVSFGY